MKHNERYHSLAVFEILPLEQLQSKQPHVFRDQLVSALQSAGYKLSDGVDSRLGITLEIDNKDNVDKLVQNTFTQEETDLAWLATNFFEQLVLILSKRELLFAFLSTKDPAVPGGPRSLPPNYMASEVGSITHPPCMPRMMCATAAKLANMPELAEVLAYKWKGYPPETSLSGSIEFDKSFRDWKITIEEKDTDIQWPTVSVLSSRILLTQQILELLSNKKRLDAIEIARATAVFFEARDKHSFNRYNHLWIKAMPGTLSDVLQEMIGASLHLNWMFDRDWRELSKEQALPHALAQSRKLKEVEEKEHSLRNSLAILQKRYPARPELIEWEVNNLYSNIVRYSPIYLAWKAHLNDFLQDAESSGNWLFARVRQLDWKVLEDNDISHLTEAMKLPELLRVDPLSTLTKMRVIIEKIIKFMYERKFPGRTADLANMIRQLNGAKLFPPIIFASLNFLRISGNIGAHELHESAGSKEDVEAILPVFVRFVEWFIDEGLAKV
jgi:hypothetical protein